MTFDECAEVIARCDAQTGSNLAERLQRQLNPEGYLPPPIEETGKDGRPRPASPMNTRLAYARQFAGYALERLSKTNSPFPNSCHVNENGPIDGPYPYFN